MFDERRRKRNKAKTSHAVLRSLSASALIFHSPKGTFIHAGSGWCFIPAVNQQPVIKSFQQKKASCRFFILLVHKYSHESERVTLRLSFVSNVLLLGVLDMRQSFMEFRNQTFLFLKSLNFRLYSFNGLAHKKNKNKNCVETA